MSPHVLFAVGVLTVVLLVIFVYVSVREVTRPHAEPTFDTLLESDTTVTTRPVRILLAIDGSPCSVAALNELAHCRLPNGSQVEVLTAIHSRQPPIPDPAFATVAARAEELRDQERRAPEIQELAVARLRRHRPHLVVTRKVVEGVPQEAILREAHEWGADRVVLGSHGYGPVSRVLLGSTAAAVAAEAPCSVQIARPPRVPDAGARVL